MGQSQVALQREVREATARMDASIKKVDDLSGSFTPWEEVARLYSEVAERATELSTACRAVADDARRRAS